MYIFNVYKVFKYLNSLNNPSKQVSTNYIHVLRACVVTCDVEPLDGCPAALSILAQALPTVLLHSLELRAWVPRLVVCIPLPLESCCCGCVNPGNAPRRPGWDSWNGDVPRIPSFGELSTDKLGGLGAGKKKFTFSDQHRRNRPLGLLKGDKASVSRRGWSWARYDIDHLYESVSLCDLNSNLESAQSFHAL